MGYTQGMRGVHTQYERGTHSIRMGSTEGLRGHTQGRRGYTRVMSGVHTGYERGTHTGHWCTQGGSGYTQGMTGYRDGIHERVHRTPTCVCVYVTHRLTVGGTERVPTG